MARLYTNENFPLPVAEELRRLGHDVLTIQEAGQGGQALPDESVLAFASGQSRALVTINRKHFIRLHLANPGHAGIVVCTFDPDFVRQAPSHSFSHRGATEPGRPAPSSQPPRSLEWTSSS